MEVLDQRRYWHTAREGSPQHRRYGEANESDGDKENSAIIKETGGTHMCLESHLMDRAANFSGEPGQHSSRDGGYNILLIRVFQT